MTDVARWLEAIGLGQHGDLFAENDIDLEILRELSDADFAELGLSLGHRRKLLKAIRDLDARDAAGPGATEADAERRHLTVMFCDLVGSTALASRLDPEDMRDVLRRYQEACAAAVARYDGHIAKYFGDGVLVYFGYPHAHEDDPRRAVLAGLGILAQVASAGGESRPGDALAVRIGIHTGLVVLGEMGAGGTREEAAIVGEAPNVAARLEALAEPGDLLISAQTRKLVGRAFACDDLGRHALKGMPEPVQVFRVTGEADGPFDATVASRGRVTVGRARELDTLVDCWARAAQGQGRAALLIGEGGIGKTHLVEALVERLALAGGVERLALAGGVERLALAGGVERLALAGDVERLALGHGQTVHHQCSPYHGGSPLYPVLDRVARDAGIGPADDPAARHAKLAALLAGSSDQPDAAATLIGPALGAIADGAGEADPLAATMSAEVRRERTLSLLVERIAALTADGPRLVVMEDAHWIDPSSAEFLERLIERAAGLKVLVLVTSRIAPPAAWSAHGHATIVPLGRLSEADTRIIMSVVSAERTLARAVRAQIIDRADGVPLFIEEMTKAVLEAGPATDAPGSAAWGERGIAIPATLRDSLAARLDNLGPVKRVAQVAAVVGRAFSDGLLARACEVADEAGALALTAALERLEAAEMIHRTEPLAPGEPGEGTRFAFRHGLMQEVAYESLLRTERARLHRLIAAALAGNQIASPGLLAHHYARAGMDEAAIGAWAEAGARCLAGSANAEAAAHFRHALALHDAGAGARPESVARELFLQAQLGVALAATAGYAAPETGAAFGRAYELCAGLDDSPQIYPVLYGLWNFYFVRLDFETANELAARFHGLAVHQGDRARLVAAHGMLAQATLLAGALDAARDHARRALALWDKEADRALGLDYGEHPALASMVIDAWTDGVGGCADTALARAEEALALAEEHGQGNTAGMAYTLLGWLHSDREDVVATRETAERVILFASEQSLPFWLAIGMALDGWARAAGGEGSTSGESAEGIAQIEESLAACRASGAEVFTPLYLTRLSQARLGAGQADEAEAAVDEALALARRTGGRVWEGDLLALKGKLRRAATPPDEAAARACYTEALEIAQAQGAHTFTLRAALGLASLDTADAADRARLADALAAMPEQSDTPDQRAARALLG